MSKIFLAASVLHNIILLNGEPLTYGELEEEPSSPRHVFKDISDV